MSLDLVIRGGTVVDGSGMAPYRADVGIQGDRIVTIGRIRESSGRSIDADGHVVAPGFIDGHTHMDAQMLWDPLGTNSCWHGVTTVVMGNCGFTLAPCRPDTQDLLLSNLERAEDLPREALKAGVSWGWDRFPSYLDCIDAVPKGINYAAYIGHSALRTWAMGERAFEERATDEDLELMCDELESALRAGAVGFTTSRLPTHETRDGRPVASRVACWQEVVQLVDVLGRAGQGIFEIAPEPASTGSDPDQKREWFERLGSLAVKTGVPTTFGVFSVGTDPRSWQDVLEFIDATCQAGGRMFGQSHSRLISYLMSFQTQLPFDACPVWSDIRQLSLAEQLQALKEPELRQKLVESARTNLLPQPNYEVFRVLRSTRPENPSVADIARQRGVDPVEAMIDLSIETELRQFYLAPSVNNNDLDAIPQIMAHPRTIMTFSDSGAHVSYIIDASIQTNLLAYWVRERQEFTLERAVQMITLAPARAWGFVDRGIVREGMIADLNIFDPATIEPQIPELVRDLPAGAPRLTQKCAGFRATVVGGQPVIENGEHTGALPGRLLRGPLAPRVS